MLPLDDAPSVDLMDTADGVRTGETRTYGNVLGRKGLVTADE